MTQHLQQPEETRQSEREAFIDSLREGRCPICAVLRTEAWELMCAWVGRSAPERQDQRAALSFPVFFCNHHFWMLVDMNTPQGNAAVAKELLEGAEQLIRRFLCSQTTPKLFPELGLSCPVCRALVQLDQMLVETFCLWLNAPETRELVLDSRGLCLPHIARCCQSLQEPSLKETLLRSCQEQLGQLIRELNGYLTKRAPSLRSGRTQDEEKSPLRSIEKLVGGRRYPRRPSDVDTLETRSLD